MSEPLDGFALGARPLYVFCSKPWSDEMMHVEEECRNYESGGWATATLTITCDGCDRLIYQKEIVDHSW